MRRSRARLGARAVVAHDLPDKSAPRRASPGYLRLGREAPTRQRAQHQRRAGSLRTTYDRNAFSGRESCDVTPYGVWSRMDQLTDVLTAISHPTRRAIIRQLAA